MPGRITSLLRETASEEAIMATEGDEELKEFPDVTSKLSAPKKLSAFEKERQAAEEKRRKAEAETAAALKEFEDSFGQENGDDDDDAYDGFPAMSGRGRGPAGPRAGAPPGYGAGGNARFGGPHSGPGSLGPPPSLKRKRALDEMREAQEARREQEAIAGDYIGRGTHRHNTHSPAPANDDDHEDVAPKPTVHLSSLPPATTVDDIKALLRDHLPVYSVHLQLSSAQGPSSRKSMTAIATLTAETAMTQIDTAVSTLKDKYLGNGFHLSISRHLSSTSALPALGSAPTTASLEPFGAQRPNTEQPRGSYSMRNAPPPSDFAPPDSYDTARRSQPQGNATISVQTPLDINTIRAIHTVVDRLLTEPDPERALQVEAMLMALPEVSKDERFSFLYDSRSAAGVYYRYLLWNDDDGYETIQERKRLARGPERIIDDVIIDWLPPYEEVPFADLSKLGEVIDHLNYESSDEESDDGNGERHFNATRREGEGVSQSSDKKHLSPLQVAKFAWLLSRMPSNHAKLRKGDVAAVTAFAINHAGAGAEEIVDMLVLNVEKPFVSMQCAKSVDHDSSQSDEDEDYEPDEDLPTIDSAPMSESGIKGDKREAEDPSQAKLVALYLINDVLHNSSTAGVRNAWKYRQLFETAFKQQKTFEHLGRLEKELGWGRIKAEQWRNRVRILFEIWEHGSVFATDVFEVLKKNFYDQPLEETSNAKEKEVKMPDEKWMGRFKKIDDAGSPTKSASSALASTTPLVLAEQTQGEDPGVDGAPLDDLDGAAIELDGAPLEDLDGMAVDDLDGPSEGDAPMSDAPKTEAATVTAVEQTLSNALPGLRLKPAVKPSSAMPTQGRRRKQAEDMFADSDEE